MTQPAGSQGRKRGRKPKAPADRLEQLTVRMSPRLKFGLDLLARAQNRSLSQAVEWAISVGISSFEVGPGSTRLGSIIDTAWAQPLHTQRLAAVYRAAPLLLDFDERLACELVEHSTEAQGRAGERLMDENESLARFVDENWQAIKAAASDLATRGESVRGVSVIEAAGGDWKG